jgi:hypothetical protein
MTSFIPMPDRAPAPLRVAVARLSPKPCPSWIHTGPKPAGQPDQVHTIVAELESLTSRAEPAGVRYRLFSLLAPVVCAITPASHDSITAAAVW